MKRNGFTLIELLAVIVILAIIALIATPIILGIINDAREKANERSVELYASAVKNGIAAYQLREGKEITPGTYNETNKLPFTVEYDGKVDCTSIIISEDGKVSLNGCTVNGGEKEYSYGIKQMKACILDDKDEDGVASLSDVITCGLESFYVMYNQNNQIIMLSMFNLNVGPNAYPNAELGIQNELAKGGEDDDAYGYINFSTSYYWSDENFELLSQYGTEYPAYVYDENSKLYKHVNQYESYLKNNEVTSANATLLSYEQLNDLKTNKGNPSWLYSTSFWTGSALNDGDIYGNFYAEDTTCSPFGVRPVITISTNEIQ